MPKVKGDKSKLRKTWLEELHLTNVMKVDGLKTVCLACATGFTFNQKSEVQQHVQTSRHKKNVQKFLALPEKQSLLIEAFNANTNKNKAFHEDVCRLFVSAGIPWSRMNIPYVRTFFEKYTGKVLPDESTIRKNYLPKLYSETMQAMRNEIGSDPIWLSIDETTDKCGRYIANVLVGALRKNEPSVPHILASKVMERTNNSTITKMVLDTLQILWPGKTQEEFEQKFLLFLTDGVAYMLKAGKNLKNLYGKMLHVTCTAHGLNRVAEHIRSLFPDVDKFIANMKAAFKKAPSRIVVYKEKCPGLPMPPDPIITRWGTWLVAAEFYATNLDQIKKVIEALKNDSAAVATLQEIIKSSELRYQLTQLTVHFTFLSEKLKEIQEAGLSLRHALKLLNDVEEKLFTVQTDSGTSVIQKLKKVISKNPDLDKIQQISGILNDDDEIENCDFISGYSPSELAAFKFAPITTVDNERSFSLHKHILSDKRRKLTPETLEMELITHFASIA